MTTGNLKIRQEKRMMISGGVIQQIKKNILELKKKWLQYKFQFIKGLSQMSEICNSPYFFDRLSFSKNEILKKLKISSMAYALIQRVDKISILFFRIVYFS